MDPDDFFDSLTGDAATLASAATSAGTSAIYGDITGNNLTPAYAATTTATTQAKQTQSLLMLLIIAFLVYKFILK